MIKYKVTNYGNTRSIYTNDGVWELSKNQTIEFNDSEVANAKEVADAFDRLEFVDVATTETTKTIEPDDVGDIDEIIEQPKPVTTKTVLSKNIIKKKRVTKK